MPNKKPQKDSKNHHYVPQGYLRNFTKDGVLCGYDKVTGKHFQNAKPRTVAAAPDFHRDDSRENPVELETRLDREFESPLLRGMSEIISRVRLFRLGLLSSPLIRAQDYQVLGRFTALQRIRTQKVRDKMLQSAPEYVTPLMSLTQDELAVGAHQRLIEAHMNDGLTAFGSALSSRRLCFFVTSRDKPFWTSDDPVIPMHGIGRKVQFGGGLGDANLELYFPLSFDILAIFVGSHVQEQVPAIYELPVQDVDHWNWFTFENAHRQVYGPLPINPFAYAPSSVTL